jgi:hypothetical protein
VKVHQNFIILFVTFFFLIDNNSCCTGGFAAVYKGTWKGKPVAIKEFKMLPMIDDTMEEDTITPIASFRHEVWIMRYAVL